MANATAEETKDTSAQEEQAQETPKKGETKEPEVDWQRAKTDEDYLAEVNASLRGEKSEPKAAEEPADKKEAEEAKAEKTEPPAEKTETEDEDPVVETILYRGQEIPVRKSQVKDLLQKGRHLEVRLQEVSPALRLMRSNPELFKMLEENPDLARQILDARNVKKGTDDVPEIEGYDKDDVKVIATVLDKLLDKRGATPPPQADKRKADTSRQYLDALSVADPNFDANYALIPQLLGEIERTMPKEQFDAFVRAIDDPFHIDETTGKPLFFGFYKEVDAERQRRAAGKQDVKQTASAKKPEQKFKVTPTSSGLIEPGATGPGRSESTGSLKDPWKMDSDSFAKMWNAKLRGDD